MEFKKVSILLFVFVGLSLAASSTELVEENGCYNSEFKLTCNHITSTIGILEATFRPNCENGNGRSNKLCLLLTQHYHEGPISIMKAISQQLVGNPLKKDEEQAVRDFLEALRSARLKEQEQEEKEVRTSEYRTELNATELQELALNETEAAVFVDYIASDRNDKRTLRNSLEKLTNFYLTRLIEDSDYYSLEDSDEDKDVNNRNKRDLRTVTRKINMRKKLNPGSCSDMNRRIGVLSQLEIQKSLRNFSNSELNIRKALNYRCSGKNHCSFIFANDHPYATFWERGTINIKYICMDDFRLNKYCGELLHVGNEIWDNDEHHRAESHEDDDDSGESPRAEARRQSEENQSHTNLKILSATDTSHKSGDNKLNFRKLEIQEKSSLDKSKQPKKENVKSTKGEIFSQDFKLIKILTNDVVAPSVTSNVDKSAENKKIYEIKKPNEMSNEISNELEFVLPTTRIFTTEQASPTSTNLNAINDVNTIESITKSYHTTDESNDITNNFSDISKSTTAAMTSATTDDVEIIIVDRVDLAKTVLNSPSTTAFENSVTEDVTEHFSTSSDVDVFNHTSFSDLAQRIENDLATSSYEEDYGSSETIKPTRRVEYAYQQKTLPSSTLLHGFISNPGYPSFYIGKSNECKWKIKIGKDQAIALTILDLHLRIDVQENCKDSLEIVDELNSKILYRGCSELSRPLQVKSISNSVEITLKTQSKTIYPKRGFLIHYQAVGCVLPPLQSRVELEYQSEDIAKYVCAENHVFPDTSSPQRVLQCINDSWNDTLVNCFHQESFESGPIHLLHNARLRKEKTMGSNDENFDAIILPSMIIIGLILINAIVFIVIYRYRKRQRQQSLDRELADL